jgi:hypothetical protein
MRIADNNVIMNVCAATHVGMLQCRVELGGLVQVPHGLVAVQPTRLLCPVVQQSRAQEQLAQPFYNHKHESAFECMDAYC